jgi:hypothetical protein
VNVCAEAKLREKVADSFVSFGFLLALELLDSEPAVYFWITIVITVRSIRSTDCIIESAIPMLE